MNWFLRVLLYVRTFIQIVNQHDDWLSYRAFPLLSFFQLIIYSEIKIKSCSYENTIAVNNQQGVINKNVIKSVHKLKKSKRKFFDRYNNEEVNSIGANSLMMQNTSTLKPIQTING